MHLANTSENDTQNKEVAKPTGAFFSLFNTCRVNIFLQSKCSEVAMLPYIDGKMLARVTNVPLLAEVLIHLHHTSGDPFLF